ncbi:serine protease [Tenacibaculum dicentrarchi]|nr:serine protease [Tenacibaculum dicentrarchi]MCD8435122.1 serine protease [Tenacibaculum dicentrarchi]
MKKLLTTLFLLTSVSLSFTQTSSFTRDKEFIKQRIKNIKECTGKILVDNVKSGTGFYVSSNGIIITNWHVVLSKKTKIDSIGKIKNKFSFVNYKNDTIPLNIILNLSNNNIIKEAISWDYCILKTKTKVNTNFLKLGDFSDAYEGATVYTSGFPLDLNEPFFSTGMISNLSTQILNKESNYNRKIAWLDMTTNKGNSGGALVLMTENPENDKVIGITSFITTPYYKTLKNLNNYITEREKYGSSQIMGINFLQYIKLINTTANSNSVGISGCISIEKVKKNIGNLNN